MSAFDDYMSAPVAAPQQGFDAYLGAAPVPAPAAGGTGAAPAQPAAGQPVKPPLIPQSGGGSKNGFLANILGVGDAQMPSSTAQPAPLGGFLTGVGDVAKGATQGIVHGLSWAADKIAPNSDFAQAARAALPQMQQTIDQQNSAYDQSRSGGGVLAGAASPGIDWGRLSGNAAATMPVAAMGGGGGLLSRIGMGGVQGAISSGLMPTTGNSDQPFWQQKATQMGIGGALGAAAPAVFAGARAAGGGLWNAVQPVVQPGRFVGQGLAGAMEPAEAAAAAANIRGAQQFVPGSVPTTAQAAQTPVMVQTEKAAGNIPAFKTASTQRAIDNNDARWQTLMGVAQDPAALDAATQARTAMAQPLYDAAHQATANVGPAFMRYARIPEMQEAMQRAHDTAALDAAVGRGVAPVWPTPGIPGGAPASRAINGSALDYTSRALGDMINDAQRSGATTRAGSLTALKSNIDSWMGQYVPGIQQARQAYAQASVPINTMEAGQQIANGLGTRAMNAGGVPEIQLNPFRTSLQQAMRGQQFGIDANALQSLQGIGQDLQRATVSNSIKSPGSDTAYNLAANGWLARQLYGPTFGGAGTIGKAVGAVGAAAMGHPMVGLGILGGGQGLGRAVGNRLQNRLSGLLMNPDTALPYLDARAAAAAQPVQGPLMQGLLNYGRPAITNGLIGGLVNANQ